jgi:hypothetical protein
MLRSIRRQSRRFRLSRQRVPNRFSDTHVFREQRFAIGTDAQTHGHYLAIPVAKQMVDYEEYYRLTPDQYRLFSGNVAAGSVFADECRARKCDDVIILAPGTDRGEPL